LALEDTMSLVPSGFRYAGLGRTAAALGMLVAVGLCGCVTVPAPTEQLAVARAAVADAAAAGAGEYAPVDLHLAQEKLERAERAAGAQDYGAARRLAEEAEVDARLGASRARSLKAQRAVTELQVSIRALQDELDRRPR
jgi:hypothetical protein